MKMSPNRRLSAVYRKEQREIRACPYRRSEEELEKEKKSSRVRQPSLFSHYLPLIPSQWSGYWDYFNIFNFFGSSKKKEEVDVVVVPEEDFIMTDSEATTTSTEESSSDSSVEITEVAETVEPVAPVEPAKPSEPTKPTSMAFPEESARPIPPSSRRMNQPIASDSSARPSSPDEIPNYSCDDDVIEWVQGKVVKGEYMTHSEYLGLKTFLERRRGDMEYEPIRLRFSPRETAPTASPLSNCAPGVAPAHRSTIPDSTSCPAISDGGAGPSPTNEIPTFSTAGPTYISAFHSSTSLPPFKNNVPSSRPPRTLKKDPNGSYVWKGAGSARSSPEETRKRPAPALPRLDPYKRRRLFEKVSSTDSPRSQTSSSNAAEAGPSIPSRTPRFVNRQHVVSHAPSLVNGSSSSPRHSSTMPTNLNASGSRSTRPTYTAAFVQEIVEKAPPRPRYSDVVNPYQTAAPVKPLSKSMEKKKMSERRLRMKELEKQREAAKAKESEKKTALTAREIIEATTPKDAKRSRPPPGLTRSRPISTFDPVVMNKRSLEDPQEELVTKKRRTVTIEEVSDDDDAASRSVPVKPNVIIESRSPSPEPVQGPSRPHAEASFPTGLSSKEPLVNAASTFSASTKEQPANVTPPNDSISKSIVKEVIPKVPSTKESSHRVPVPSTKMPSLKSSANHFTPLLNAKMAGRSSVPREPSKLRTSFLPDDYENEEPKVPSPTPATPVEMTTPGIPLADIQEKKDPKEVALSLPLNELPPYVFKSPPAITASDHMGARAAAKELPVTSLPKFDFSKARTSMNRLGLPAVPIPTIKPFGFNAAGIKPPTSASNGQWKCPTCMLQNPITVEKCTICDSPRRNTEEPRKVAVNGVNGANGVKGVGGGNASEAFTSPPAVKAFDFAAAGFKPKPVAAGQWTCSTCMLQNPPTAVEKCEICDSPRPGMEKVEKPKKPYMNGSAQPAGSHANGISTSTVKPFDFAAAGMKPPGPPSNGNWQCRTCMLQNPATAIEKCKICDSPRPGSEKRKAAELSVVPVKTPVPVVSKPFDWAAAGMAPPKMNNNSWTCGTCMLSNPSTETEKCRVCDASRS